MRVSGIHTVYLHRLYKVFLYLKLLEKYLEMNSNLKTMDANELTCPSYVNPADAASGKLEVTYTPDALDRIDTITSGAAVFADYDYEGVRKVSSKKLSNSAIEMLKAYDPGGRPTTLTYQTVSGKLFDFGMDWTLLDMKASETQGKVTKNYLYDSESRLR
ncbi:MAG: hypothetical protein GY765_27345, partial [bacterium]|nr:hypothetical protein [bacterium]